MNKRRTNLLAALARARPARLDANAALQDSWPTVTQLIETAESADGLAEGLAENGIASGPHHGESAAGGRPRRRPVPAKLLGAITSAAVTAVVIVIAVTVGAVVVRPPHGQPSSSASSSPGQPHAGELVFRSLPLEPHWHGHASYAMSDGVVYLSGIATLDHQASQSGRYGPIAKLPQSARPLGGLVIVASFSGGVGAITVHADGQIEEFKQQAGVTWVSLGGVSFQVGSR
jgi:hypothetical protein